ncbi:MAG: apolipoprotein N-acyltransferase [Parvibaculum sp.]
MRKTKTTPALTERASEIVEQVLARAERASLYLYGLAGWKRLLAAFALGVLSVAAQPPFELFAALAFTLPALVWLLDGTGEPSKENWRAARRAAAIGWWFGFGYFFASLYWIGEAFLVEADTFGWMLPFAVTGLPAGLGFFTAIAFAVARFFWGKGVSRVLVLALAWTVAEWLRGHILTGLPWNLLGQVAAASDALMQSAALFGVYGLTLVLLLVFLSPAAFDPRLSTKDKAYTWKLDAVGRPVLIAYLSLMLLWLGGAMRLAASEAAFVEGVTLRLVQPNVEQQAKWLTENRQEILGLFLRMSDEAPKEGPEPTHILWPESAIPFLVDREPVIRSAISRILSPGGVLMLGSVRGEADPSSVLSPNARPTMRFYNSFYVMGPDGEIRSTYDKAHLVPFGEYLPLQNLLEAIGLQQLTRLRGGYHTGTGPMTLQVPGAPAVSPLICYEIIFPGRSVGAERPGWIANVTNDAWFGQSAGPYQHLAQARLRSVEQGLPVARAANTGISAMIDPYGRVLNSIPLNTVGVLDTRLPEALPAPLYARVGDLVFFFMIAGLIVLVRLTFNRL